MAVTIAQLAWDDDGSGATFGSPVTAGNTLVGVIYMSDQVQTNSTLSSIGNGTNTLSPIANATTIIQLASTWYARICIAYLTNIQAGTGTYVPSYGNAASYHQLQMYELTPCTLVNGSNGNGNGVNVDAGSVTTTANGAIGIYGGLFDADATSDTGVVGSGYNIDHDGSATPSWNRFYCNNPQTSAGSLSGIGVTSAHANPFIAAMAAFQLGGATTYNRTINAVVLT